MATFVMTTHLGRMEMKWRQLVVASAGATIIAIGVACANDVGGIEVNPAASAPAVAHARISPAENLSPGNRLIANALYAAQGFAGGGVGQQPWTLDRIAAARAEGESWGEVFGQMKTANLLAAKTLGQVVAWYQYTYLKPEPDFHGLRATVATVPSDKGGFGN